MTRQHLLAMVAVLEAQVAAAKSPEERAILELLLQDRRADLTRVSSLSQRLRTIVDRKSD